MRKIAVILLLILICGGAFFLATAKKQPSNKFVITLTNDGFKPNEITIKKGDEVVFKNTTGKPFWPASNIHPTHGIYPEFDPKDAIMPDKTWSFKFDRVGKWSFHDHLAPYYIGKIIVTQ